MIGSSPQLAEGARSCLGARLQLFARSWEAVAVRKAKKTISMALAVYIEDQSWMGVLSAWKEIQNLRHTSAFGWHGPDPR